MSSEVQAKCTNSSERCTSRFLASFDFSQYSIALTSWLVSASMFLMCSASRSENACTNLEKAFLVAAEKGLNSLIARCAASGEGMGFYYTGDAHFAFPAERQRTRLHPLQETIAFRAEPGVPCRTNSAPADRRPGAGTPRA